ncbi:MAG: hypothetical protein M1812_002914 [Candelaria pacifica]|nr:MAG: hypothetical protein M1812_002914 [Candelaria pacifica]
MREIDPVISAYEHLQEKPRQAEALKSLQKVASLVKPIMRQRGWKVGILTEFYPLENNLLGLNWNAGEKICLRLRYPYDEKQFIPMEQVVDTMLHELSHIVHGPHDAKFHALWNQLREEHEQLIRKGYTGEGFLSEGKKLGGKRIPIDEARRRARAAAEKRQVLTKGSGQKLGGASVGRGTDMRRVIADAATRRTTVTRGCASGTKESKGIMDQASKNGFRTKAEEDDANEQAIIQAYIELLQEEEKEKWGDSYVPPSQANPAGNAYDGQESSDYAPERSTDRYSPPPRSSPANSRPISRLVGESSSKARPDTLTNKRPTTNERPIDLTHSDEPRRPSNSSTPIRTTWTCSICTLENPLNYLCCDACTTERPESITAEISSIEHPSNSRSSGSQSRLGTSRQPSKAATKPLGWSCHQCGTFMGSQWWTCSSCGTMKLSS